MLMARRLQLSIRREFRFLPSMLSSLAYTATRTTTRPTSTPSSLKPRREVNLYRQRRRECHSSGTTGASIRTSTIQKTRSAVLSTRHYLPTNKVITRASVHVKSVHSSTSSRQPFRWLTNHPSRRPYRNMVVSVTEPTSRTQPRIFA